MAFSHSALTVKTSGQTLSVTAYRSGSTSATCPLHLTSAVSSAQTQPYSISADTTFYIPDDHAGFWVVSVKQPDGTELWGQEEYLGAGEKVIAPLPSAAQVGADVGRRGLSLAPTGALAETYSRAGVTFANSSALSTGRLTLSAIELPAGLTVSSITFVCAGTSAVTPTAQWFALYDGDRVLLGQTADDTSTAWANPNAKTLSFATPVTTTKSGLHYVGICVVAGTVPTLLGASTITAGTGKAPILAGYADTGLTTTAPDPAATITADTRHVYAYVS